MNLYSAFLHVFRQRQSWQFNNGFSKSVSNINYCHSVSNIDYWQQLRSLINYEQLVEATRTIHVTLQFLSIISIAVHSTYNTSAVTVLTT